jgi:hypothetical protein
MRLTCIEKAFCWLEGLTVADSKETHGRETCRPKYRVSELHFSHLLIRSQQGWYRTGTRGSDRKKPLSQ